MAKAPTVHEFFKKFANDSACLEHLMMLRFGNPMYCPKCGAEGRFAKLKKLPAYACPTCGHHIHPMVGTPFERSRTPLHKWFYAMYLFTTTRHGVPAKELQRQLGLTYKTAWRMGDQIRKYMAKIVGDDPLDGHVEVDDTYAGARRKGGKRGRGAPGKTVVFGMLERAGDVMTRVVPDVRRATLDRDSPTDGSSMQPPSVSPKVWPGGSAKSQERLTEPTTIVTPAPQALTAASTAHYKLGGSEARNAWFNSSQSWRALSRSTRSMNCPPAVRSKNNPIGAPTSE